MSYKIAEIEGIGERYALTLEMAGIRTTDDLLHRASSARRRDQLSDETGISPKLILKWANHADLFRIKGVASQFAELLEAAGVDTIKEFRHRVAANLQPRLVEINDQKHFCHRVPSLSEVERMIEQAKGLQPILTY